MFRALVFVLAATCCIGADSAEQAIRRVLSDQAQAWNRGDIDGYMTGYVSGNDIYRKDRAAGISGCSAQLS